MSDNPKNQYAMTDDEYLDEAAKVESLLTITDLLGRPWWPTELPGVPV